MTKLATEMYSYFKSCEKYIYSQDLYVKLAEINALMELEQNKCIRIRTQADDFVIAAVV